MILLVFAAIAARTTHGFTPAGWLTSTNASGIQTESNPHLSARIEASTADNASAGNGTKPNLNAVMTNLQLPRSQRAIASNVSQLKNITFSLRLLIELRVHSKHARHSTSSRPDRKNSMH